MRCDINVNIESNNIVHPIVEIKNVQSVKYIEKAIGNLIIRV